MIIVTGGAGFIGANIVRGLNARGVEDILVVDNLSNVDKVKNLADLKIADYMDKEAFYKVIKDAEHQTTDAFPGLSNISAVFHEGACSDTMATDGRYVLQNNFTYTKALFHYCQKVGAQFIYASSASVYGAGEVFKEQPEYESVLNAYAYSKLLFDQYVRCQPTPSMQCVGLRYFNVYGPREQHKGRMASVAWHFRNQFNANGKVRLFAGTGGYSDGEQRRDFIYVEDVVKVNLYLLDHPDVNGIFNLGTGQCQSFNDVAVSVINSLRKRKSLDSITLKEGIRDGLIEYIPMPDALNGKYQSFTEADMTLLRNHGYAEKFHNVEQGVASYMDLLETNE
ncbi:MAG: ADP-glyceromanno-heptose 6-epimerase [Acidiferrobacterales bacterium]|nr:ADP-glyceromanno-heptose 6-epimerase [Acidiferrobacterales bacterium]